MKLVQRLPHAIGSLALVGGVVLGGAGTGAAATHTVGHGAAGHSASAAKAEIPAALQVPEGNKRVAELSAKGVQVYTCANGGWTLLEPAATLWRKGDLKQKTIALHSRGPVWVSTVDGSAVNAAAVANSPRTGTIPELLLKATANRGDGVFGKVSYIQRLETGGGVAPAGTCTDADQVSVPYTATYAFYAPTTAG
ncbi:DUF3455 domain-containing protein [Streptomyces sp. NPDC093109]|uniref:DUF3455 domain-containing protein n=1 Tax=Streptomyces sp. NPDC093109 TaxID=3154977 RepID=UPI00344DDEC0